ncbi:MAG: alpha/beta fold hydrolase [Cyanobacteria bacterium P01_G01_bin.54]
MTQSVAPTPPATSPSAQYWQWRGHTIHYVQAGANPNQPPLLLVHGFGASTDHWRKNIADLQADFEVWAIDLLGFGRSAKPDLTYSGDLWRDQLHDFITEKIGRPVVLVGNSLGGYASLCVAAQRSTSAAGLVLLNCAGPFTESPDTPQPPAWKQAIGTLTKQIFLQPWGSYLLFQYLRQPRTIRRTLEQVYVNKAAVTDQLVADIRRPSDDPGALQVFGSVFKSPQGEKNDVLLRQLQCPLLLLWGTGDPWMKVSDRAPKFRAACPELTEYFLEAGHCPHDEVPEQVDQHLRDWVQQLGVGQTPIN